MSGYHYAKRVTVTNAPEPKPPYLKWAKRAGKNWYQVRSDAGAMSTRIDDAETLTEARRIARQRARVCGWAEVFRWAESGVMLRKVFICSYDREVTL